jgi:hypothetical protein
MQATAVRPSRPPAPPPPSFRGLLIACSVLLNAALALAVIVKPSLAPPEVRDWFAPRAAAPAAEPATPTPAAKPAAKPAISDLWSTAAAGDLPGLIAKLRAAGYPPNVIRSLIGALMSERYDARLRLTESDPNTPFWQLKTSFTSSSDPRLLEMNRLQRERAKLLRDLFADPFFGSTDTSAAQRQRFGDLSPQKIELLQRIEDDYSEMTSAIRAAMRGVTLPEDRDQLALLTREKRADLAAVLSPQELADYEMRTSPITNRLRSTLASFDPSETEFRAIYEAQRHLSDQFPGGPQNMDFRAREAAQSTYLDEVRGALGDARFNQFMREQDREYQQLSRLAEQQKLQPGVAQQAYQLRDNLERESNAIFDNAALSADQKRAALATLAQSTRSQLLLTLGPVAGPNYVQTAERWLGNVERGAAVSFKNSVPMTFTSDTGGTITYLGGPSFRNVPRPPPNR